MCGLVAVIPKTTFGFTKEHIDIFDSLLFIDQIRGGDSTGVAMIERDGSMVMAKEASNSTVFRDKKEYKDILNSAYKDGTALFGHNRAATRGIINDENAHPFVVDDRITLIHNGTLWGDHKKLANTEVDSHAIAHVIHKHDGDVEAAMKEINGAYALIWHDFKENTLNIIRNSQRPLCWMETENAWYWASASDMLQWIKYKYNLKVTEDVTPLSENTLVKYSRKAGAWDLESTEIKVAPTTTYTPGWSKYVYGGYGGELGCDYTPPRLDHTKTTNGIVERMKDIEEDLAEKYLSHFTYAEFSNLTEGFRTGELTNMICLDVTEASPTNPGAGWFIYGLLESQQEILVKVHLASAYTEAEVMDLAVNSRKCQVKLKTKTWAAYRTTLRTTSPCDGYAMYTAGELSLVEEAATT